MKQNRIKLLVTLVLFMLAVASACAASQADARGLPGPGASSFLSAAQPGAAPASGDPDVGQGIAPPPPQPMRRLLQQPGSGVARGPGFSDWVRWTGRIWATLFLRAAH